MRIIRKTDMVYFGDWQQLLVDMKVLMNKEGFTYEHFLFKCESQYSADLSKRFGDVCAKYPSAKKYFTEKQYRFVKMLEMTNCTDDWKPVEAYGDESKSGKSRILEEACAYVLKKRAAEIMTVCYYNVSFGKESFVQYPGETAMGINGVSVKLSDETEAAPVMTVPSVTVTFSLRDKSMSIVSVTELLCGREFSKPALPERSGIFRSGLNLTLYNTTDRILVTGIDIKHLSVVCASFKKDIEFADLYVRHWKGPNRLFGIETETSYYKGSYTTPEKKLMTEAGKFSFSLLSKTKDTISFIRTDEYNHALKVSFLIGNVRGRIDAPSCFFGVGFNIDLPSHDFTPIDNTQLIIYADAVFSCVNGAYETHLKKLSASMPASPSWYVYR